MEYACISSTKEFDLLVQSIRNDKRRGYRYNASIEESVSSEGYDDVDKISHFGNGRRSDSRSVEYSKWSSDKRESYGGVKEKFSLRENVEETKDLIAVHNLSAEKLMKSLNLGGLPMHSIAITKAKQGYSELAEVR